MNRHDQETFGESYTTIVLLVILFLWGMVLFIGSSVHLILWLVEHIDVAPVKTLLLHGIAISVTAWLSVETWCLFTRIALRVTITSRGFCIVYINRREEWIWSDVASTQRLHAKRKFKGAILLHIPKRGAPLVLLQTHFNKDFARLFATIESHVEVHP